MSQVTPPPAGIGSTAGPAGEARKKRRFFAAKLPALPLVNAVSTSKPTVVSSDKVLAALLPPKSVEPPPRIERPRREVRDRLDAVSAHDLSVPSKTPNPDGQPGSSVLSTAGSPPNAPIHLATSTTKIKPIQPSLGEISEASGYSARREVANGTPSDAVNPVASSGVIVEKPKTTETSAIPPQLSGTSAISRPTSRWWKTTEAAEVPAPKAPATSSAGGISKSTTIKLSRGKGLDKTSAANNTTANTTPVTGGQTRTVTHGQEATPSHGVTKSTKIKLKAAPAVDKIPSAVVPTAGTVPLPQSSTQQLQQPELSADRANALKQIPIKLKQPPPYKKIDEKRAPRMGISGAACKCDPARGCGRQCQDRATNLLCGPRCSCAGKCGNIRLAKRRIPLTAVVYTGSRGFGLLAMKDIKKGDFVIDYRGEVISIRTFQERCRNEYANNTDFYAMAYDKTEVIDAGTCGNEARFINHSCSPNLEVRKYSLRGDNLDELEVGLWALRDIDAGEELSFDYNLAALDSDSLTDERIACRCGESECVGYLGRVTGLRGFLSVDEEAGLRARPISKKRKHKSMPGPAMPMSEPIMVDEPRILVEPTTPSASISQESPALVKKKLILRASLPSQKNQSLERPQDTAVPDTNALVAEMDPERLAAENPPKKKKRRSINANPLLPRVKRPKRDVPGLTSPFTSVPLSSLRYPPAPHSEEIEESFPPFSTPALQGDPDGRSSSPPQRNSGWADWLVRKAGEKPRTLEQWQDFAIQRRRGKEWKEKMMELFGVAPYEGGPRLPWDAEHESHPPLCLHPRRGPRSQYLWTANLQEAEAGPSSAAGDTRVGQERSQSADFVDEEIDELDPSEPPSDHEEEDRKPTIPSKTPTPEKSPNATGHGKGKARQLPLFASAATDRPVVAQGGPAPSTLPAVVGAVTDVETPNRSAAASRLWPIFAQTRPAPASAVVPPSLDPLPPTNSAEAPAPARGPSPTKQPTEKKRAIAKRNGAPMGWAYVPVTTEPAAAPAPIDIGPRSARKGRATNLKDDDRRKSLPVRR